MLLQNLILKDNKSYVSATIEIAEGIIKNIYKSSISNIDIERDFLVTPGFVNCHLHPSQLMDKGSLDFLSIPELLSLQHTQNTKTEQDRYIHALFVLMDAIKSGATSIYSVASNPLPIIKAYKRLNIKGAITCFFNDVWEGEGASPKICDIKSISQKFSALYKERTKDIDVHIGSASLQTASDQMLKFLNIIALEYNTKVNIHVGEGKESVQSCLDSRGSTPIRLLAKLGVLSSRWNLIHAINIDAEEIKIIADSGANIILCPISNSKTGAGIPPVDKFIKHAVNIALGTDACSNNNTNNILNEAYFTILLTHGINQTPALINSDMMMEWLTTNGYKTLGSAQTGKIEVGQPADLLLWSLKQNSFIPLRDKGYHSSLFYNAPDIKPHTVMVKGNKIIDNYKFLNIDEDKLRLLVHHTLKKSSNFQDNTFIQEFLYDTNN
jgi:5-methylthioadenosine/S-adenosylhomocysteine deaminase